MFFAIVAFIGTIISIILGMSVGINVLGFTDGYIIRSVANTLLILLGINVVCAIVCQFFEKKINPFSKLHQVGKWEEKVLKAFNVRAWKDKIPELGKTFNGFDKSQVGDMNDNQHVRRFITQTIVAEYVHISSTILGCFAIFACLPTWHIVGLPLLLANIIINIMPVMVQRYNRPKLMALYKRNERREQLAKTTESNETTSMGISNTTEGVE